VLLALALVLSLTACPARGVADAGRSSGPADAGSPTDGGSAPEPPAAPPPPFVERRAASPLWAEIADAGWALAFTSERSGVPQVHHLAGELERALTFEATHHLQDVARRRDELLVSRVEGPAEQLVAVQVTDGGMRDVSPGLEKAHAAVLSADEQWVAFESSLAGASDVALVPFDGSAPPRLVVAEPTGSFQPAFTPDGRSLVVTSSSTGDPELYRQPLDGGARVRLTAFHLEDFGGVPANDGTRVAFVSNREGIDRVFVQRLDGRGVQRLSAEARGPDAAESNPVWMPDGRSVLVTVRDGKTLVMQRIDVATRRVRWTTSGGDQLPCPSPDGRYVAFVSDRAGSADVYVMRADGSGASQLTSHEAPEYGPRWTSARRGAR
jgi:TolB protein